MASSVTINAEVTLSDESKSLLVRLEKLCAEMRELGLVSSKPLLDDLNVDAAKAENRCAD